MKVRRLAQLPFNTGGTDFERIVLAGYNILGVQDSSHFMRHEFTVAVSYALETIDIDPQQPLFAASEEIDFYHFETFGLGDAVDDCGDLFDQGLTAGLRHLDQLPGSGSFQ